MPKPGLPITFVVSGKTVELRYPLKVLREMEAQHSISILNGDSFVTTLRNPEKLALLIWYGAKTKQPDITLDWIEENIDASMLLDLAPVIAYATTGRKPESAVRPNGAASDSVGLTSGQSADTISDSPNLKSGA